LLTLFC